MRRFKTSMVVLGISTFLAAAANGQQPRRAGEPGIDARTVAPDSPGINPTLSSSAQALVPRLMKFSGVLHEASGKPLTGTVDVTFSLYSSEAGGAPLWFETQSVQADELGRYTALLGAMHTDGLPMDLFTSGEAHWLGIQVGLEAEQQPRVLLVSVPYALKAGDAETLGGKPASAYMLADTQSGTGSTTTGTSTSTSASTQTGTGGKDTKGRKTNATPATPCSAVTSDGTATANSIAMFTTACNLQISALTQGGSNNIGVGTTTPGAKLQVATASDSNPPLIPAWDIRHMVVGAASSSSGGVGISYDGTHNVGYVQTVVPSVAWGKLVLQSSGGSVGVGTTAPSGKFQVATASDSNPPLIPAWDVRHMVVGAASSSSGGVGISYDGTHNVGYLQTVIPNVAWGNLVLQSGAGNVGIGTTTPGATLDVVGNINSSSSVTGRQLVSNVTTGTPPLTVVSTTVVTSLNADTVDGHHASDFQATGNYATIGPNTFLATQTISSGDLSISSGRLNLSTAGAIAFGGTTMMSAPNGNNIGVGTGSNLSVTTGQWNTAVGSNGALYTNSTGSNNTATGFDALFTANADGNSAYGTFALQHDTSGTYNTGIGDGALAGNTTGGSNTAVGVSSGLQSGGILTSLTGSSNTFLGASSDYGSTTQTNSTAIGANAEVDASNALVLGSINGTNGATSSVNVGIGTTSPSNFLDVYIGSSGPVDSGILIHGSTSTFGDMGLKIQNTGTGGTTWYLDSTNNSSGYGGSKLAFVAGSTLAMKLSAAGDLTVAGCFVDNAGTNGTCSSDRRLKTNIQPFQPVLNRLIQLQPVHYNWKASNPPDYHFGSGRYAGLIAQDVEKIFPEMVSTDVNGFKRVNYSELPYLMLESIRELKMENDGLKRAVTEKDERLASLANQVEELRRNQAQMREIAVRLAKLEARIGAARPRSIKRTAPARKTLQETALAKMNRPERMK